MADLFKLTGSYSTQPAVGAPSASPQVVSTGINESITLAQKSLDDYVLTADAAQVVDFGGLLPVGAHLVIIKVASGGKVKVRITTTDGATQSIPVDSVLHLISLSVPVTAIDLTRIPGTPTEVTVFLGQSA